MGLQRHCALSLAALLLLSLIGCSQSGGSTAAVLNLDDDAEQDASEEPIFTLPITVKGAQVECGYFEGQDPVDVAIEFGPPP